MAKDKDLIPVFMPPLATLLAHAEELKGAPLTETDVVRIRDKSVCMMMERKDAEALIPSRGFRDVEPENCWADWHRLRVEMTGKGCLPKIVLCLVGDAGFANRAGPILAAAGAEHEFRDRNPRMVAAFQASACAVAPTLDAEELEKIAHHQSVLYLLSKNFTSAQAPETSRAMLGLGARLLEAGGLAMKCESSGIAHGRERWIALAEQAGSQAEGQSWPALFRAYVQFPIASDTDLYTCGMHLLGKPDLIAAKALDAEDLAGLFQTFALYLLGECPEGRFAPGHTFRADDDSPRFVVRWEPCTEYDEDDFFFNPFGRWRFATHAD